MLASFLFQFHHPITFHVLFYFLISRDGDKMASAVEKKIAELEMGLLHLQQNIDIPDISLPIHPVVAQVCY